MAGSVGSRAWLPRILGWVLVACALANAAAAVTAWHRQQLLLTLSPEQAPYGGGALLEADLWFGNLMGGRKVMIAVSGVLLLGWLDSMRGLADGVWPRGRRRSRAWLLFG